MKAQECPHQTDYEQYKMQFFATAVASLSALSTGAVVGYTSPAMDGMQKSYSLDEQEVSLVTSISMFGSIFGSLAGGTISNRFGRKHSLILTATFCSLGWLILVCAQLVSMLYIGRFVGGFAIAMGSATAPVYVTEIASPEIRGALGSCYVLFAGIGVLYVYILGTFISWRYLALAGMIVPTTQIALLLLLPETPIWLWRNGDIADDALKWLKRSVKLSEFDFEQNTPDTDGVTLKSVFEPALLKPFAIVGMLMLITQFSGIGVIVVYAVSIFRSATESIDPNLSSIIVGVSLVVAHLITFSLVDKVGRRILLLVSGIFMAAGMISLGTYYYSRACDLNSVSNITWLPVTSLVIYTLAYGVGFGPVPWLMMGELFPNKVRGLASAIIAAFNWTVSLIVAKTFVDMQDAMHDYGVFWFYGAVSVFAVFFTYCYVPETSGKTFIEIEDQFKGIKILKVISTS